MVLTQKEGDNLFPINTVPPISEKEIQKCVESSLNNVFNLKFIATEFIIDDFRLDTLAFDVELNTFVIIEYKKKHSQGLLAQGLAYLSKINERQAEIVIEYNRKTKNQKQVKDFDWPQIRVIFVAPKFDKNQIQAVKLDYHIELWELTIFDGGMWNFVLLNPLNKPINASKQNNKTVKLPTGIKPTYTEEYHFDHFSSDITKSLYIKYKELVTDFDTNIEIVSRQKHISFKIDNTAFSSISLKKNSINFDFYVTTNELDDPKNLLQNMTNTGSWTGCKSRIISPDEETMLYCVKIARQCYDFVKSSKHDKKLLNRTNN